MTKIEAQAQLLTIQTQLVDARKALSIASSAYKKLQKAEAEAMRAVIDADTAESAKAKK